MWVKPIKVINRDWAMSQYPYTDTTRALTLNDREHGYVGIVTGARQKHSSLARAAIGEWNHLVGVWHQNGTSFAYLNGKKSAGYQNTNNSFAQADVQSLIIGEPLLCCVACVPRI